MRCIFPVVSLNTDHRHRQIHSTQNRVAFHLPRANQFCSRSTNVPWPVCLDLLDSLLPAQVDRSLSKPQFHWTSPSVQFEEVPSNGGREVEKLQSLQIDFNHKLKWNWSIFILHFNNLSCKYTANSQSLKLIYMVYKLYSIIPFLLVWSRRLFHRFKIVGTCPIVFSRLVLAQSNSPVSELFIFWQKQPSVMPTNLTDMYFLIADIRKYQRQSAVSTCRRFKGWHSFDRIAELLVALDG